MTRITRLVPALAGLLLATTGAAATTVTTGSTGSGVAFSTLQPSLAMASYVVTQGIYPQRDYGAAYPFMATLGQVRTLAANRPGLYAGYTTGALLNANQNTALYSLLGNAFGGTVRQSFGLPNLDGRIMVDTSYTTPFASQQGAASVALTTANMPAHDHDVAGGGTTSTTGGGQAFDGRQPSLALTMGISSDGRINVYAENFTPYGTLPLNGASLSIADNGQLYAAIGCTYGCSGSTFSLPNLQGRATVGAGGAYTLGQAFGDASTTLTEANLPSHTHGLPDGTTTLPEGDSAAFSNYQPSLALNYGINVAGLFPTADQPLSDDLYSYTSEIAAFAGALPDGWLLADGRLLPLTRPYYALFALIGTTYGGDGTNSFALPNLIGRSIIGTGYGSSGYAVGQQVGAATTTLSVANLPAHTHTLTIADPAPPVAAVPEPASWAMMVAGFGAVGAGLRRRRARVALA